VNPPLPEGRGVCVPKTLLGSPRRYSIQGLVMVLSRLLGRPALTLAAWAERICLSQVDVPNAVRSGLVPVRPEVALRSSWGRLALIFTGRAHRPNGQIKFNCQTARSQSFCSTSVPLSTTPSPCQPGEAPSALALQSPRRERWGTPRNLVVFARERLVLVDGLAFESRHDHISAIGAWPRANRKLRSRLRSATE